MGFVSLWNSTGSNACDAQSQSGNWYSSFCFSTARERMINILTEKYCRLMHVKNSESRRKTNTEHLTHPINHRNIKTPKNRQQGLTRCALNKGGGADRALSFAGGRRHPVQGRFAYFVSREFCSRGKCFIRVRGH